MKRKKSIAGRLSVISGLSGLLFGIFIKYTGIMKEYGDWLHSGMNAQNPSADLLLIIYGCLVLLLIVVSITKSFNNQNA
jgi:hypothetical protein